MSVEGRRVGDVVLGLARFRLLDATELDGELELLVNTDADVVGCRACGVRAVSHGRRDTLVRDVAFSDRATRLRWRKRVWRCHDPDCEVATWTETSGHIAARAGLTERAKQAACVAVGGDGDSVAGGRARVRGGLGHGHERRLGHGAPLVDDPARTREVAALGLDETVFLRHEALMDRGEMKGLHRWSSQSTGPKLGSSCTASPPSCRRPFRAQLPASEVGIGSSCWATLGGWPAA